MMMKEMARILNEMAMVHGDLELFISRRHGARLDLPWEFSLISEFTVSGMKTPENEEVCVLVLWPEEETIVVDGPQPEPQESLTSVLLQGGEIDPKEAS